MQIPVFLKYFISMFMNFRLLPLSTKCSNFVSMLHVELAKLSMRKDYALLTFMKSKKIFSFALKTFSFEIIKNFFPQLQLILPLRFDQCWFSWVVHKFTEICKKSKINYMAADGYTENFRVWWAFRIFDFYYYFFFFKRFSIKFCIWKSNSFFPSFGCGT